MHEPNLHLTEAQPFVDVVRIPIIAIHVKQNDIERFDRYGPDALTGVASQRRDTPRVGALARASKRSYPYGAFLDSTTDRYSEGAVYAGVAAFFLWHPGPWAHWETLACLLALGGSFLVSYVRARAQSLGYRCDSGLFARPERVVLTVAALLLGQPEILVPTEHGCSTSDQPTTALSPA